jgi:DNA repair protein RecO (recombination protein O)
MSTIPKSYKAEGIVLRHQDYKEADRILTIFTRQFGKVTVVGRGVRKQNSRKGGHLDLMNHVQIQVATGKAFDVITQAEMMAGFDVVKQDLVLLGYGATMMEMVDKFTFDQEEHTQAFFLLVQALHLLELELSPELILRIFEVKVPDSFGFRPELHFCTQCNAKIEYEDQFFQNLSGGVICPKCGRTMDGVTPISKDVLRYMRHFQRSDFRGGLRAQMSEAEMREMEHLNRSYLHFVLEKGLNSPQFLRRMQRDVVKPAQKK